MTNHEAADIARRCWRTLEPYHGMIYFVPEAVEAYERIGVTGRSGYFGSRSAAMGAVGPLVVRATFFNFHPALVGQAMTGLWDAVTPTQLLDARYAAADAALVRFLGDEVDSPGVIRAVELIRPAVDAACSRPEGRPLFAGHASVPEPDVPHRALWHAVTLLREFRGDGHVAALVDAELSGIEALVVHGATGDVPNEVLRTTRAWSEDEWRVAADGLASRGLLGRDGTLSPTGRSLRDHVESRTDELATPAWSALDVDDAGELRRLVRPWSRVIAATAFG